MNSEAYHRLESVSWVCPKPSASPKALANSHQASGSRKGSDSAPAFAGRFDLQRTHLVIFLALSLRLQNSAQYPYALQEGTATHLLAQDHSHRDQAIDLAADSSSRLHQAVLSS